MKQLYVQIVKELFKLAMPLDCIHSYLRLYLYLLKTLYSEFASLSSFIDLQCSHHPKSR